MFTIVQFTDFLGWMTLINACLLIFTSIVLMVGQSMVASLHSKMFKVPEDQLSSFYFNYVAIYKVLFIIFNLVPWIVLCWIMKY